MTAPPSPLSLVGAVTGGETASQGMTLSGSQLASVIAAILVLVVLAGFFAMAETALTRMSRMKAVALQEGSRRGSNALLKVVNAPERYINPILLLVLVCHTLMATLVGTVFGPLGLVGFLVSYAIELVVIFVLA
ncbi:MAG: CNNM domain-containing protein [Acidimicrobiales bacterium]